MAGLNSSNYVFLVITTVSVISYVFYIIRFQNVLENGRISISFQRKPTEDENTDPKRLPLQYSTPVANGSGKTFDSKLPLKIPTYFIDLDKYDVANFTFVTAADPAHFNESKDAVAGFQEVFPEYTIVYYDLGLDPVDVEKMKTWCNVKYRKIDYDKYPAHIRIHLSYAFKSVIIYEMLQEVDAIFWIDASIRPKVTNRTRWSAVYAVARTSGIVQFDHSGHNIYCCTHPGMYSYLPADLDRLKQSEMLGSGAVLIYRTKKVFWEIVYWHYLCGLTLDCVTPPGHTSDCQHATPNVSFCHRYDQSSFDVLVANSMAYNRTLYTAPENFVVAERYPTRHFQLKRCDAG